MPNAYTDFCTWLKKTNETIKLDFVISCLNKWSPFYKITILTDFINNPRITSIESGDVSTILTFITDEGLEKDIKNASELFIALINKNPQNQKIVNDLIDKIITLTRDLSDKMDRINIIRNVIRDSKVEDKLEKILQSAKILAREKFDMTDIGPEKNKGYSSNLIILDPNKTNKEILTINKTQNQLLALTCSNPPETIDIFEAIKTNLGIKNNNFSKKIDKAIENTQNYLTQEDSYLLENERDDDAISEEELIDKKQTIYFLFKETKYLNNLKNEFSGQEPQNSEKVKLELIKTILPFTQTPENEAQLIEIWENHKNFLLNWAIENQESFQKFQAQIKNKDPNENPELFFQQALEYLDKNLITFLKYISNNDLQSIFKDEITFLKYIFNDNLKSISKDENYIDENYILITDHFFDKLNNDPNKQKAYQKYQLISAIPEILNHDSCKEIKKGLIQTELKKIFPTNKEIKCSVNEKNGNINIELPIKTEEDLQKARSLAFAANQKNQEINQVPSTTIQNQFLKVERHRKEPSCFGLSSNQVIEAVSFEISNLDSFFKECDNVVRQASKSNSSHHLGA